MHSVTCQTAISLKCIISSDTEYPIYQASLESNISMAFEVARVHKLICSRVGDEGGFDALKTVSHSVEADQSFPRSCSPQGANLHMYYPAGSLYYSRSFDQGNESSNLPPEASSCSTETESDEEDDLLQSLAQQIAQSMLDEEGTKADTCAGVLKGNIYTGALDLPNVDVNEVSICIDDGFLFTFHVGDSSRTTCMHG